MVSALRAKSGRQRQVIVDGNSLAASLVYENFAYGPNIVACLGEDYLYTVEAAGSQTTSQMITLGPTQIDPQYQAQRLKNILVAWEVTNDVGLGGANAAQAYDHMVTYCSDRRARGFQVVVMTVLPINQTLYPTFEATRQTVNTNIRNNWATFADAIADVGADPTIGEAGDETNLTYYEADQVHLKYAGYAIAGPYVRDAILTL